MGKSFYSAISINDYMVEKGVESDTQRVQIVDALQDQGFSCSLNSLTTEDLKSVIDEQIEMIEIKFEEFDDKVYFDEGDL